MASHSKSKGASKSAGTFAVPSMQPRRLLDFGSGTTRAKGFPRFMIWTDSPFSNHLETRPKSFLNSRTVAVFMVIHLSHEAFLSTVLFRLVRALEFHPDGIKPGARANEQRLLVLPAKTNIRGRFRHGYHPETFCIFVKHVHAASAGQI